MRMPGSLGHILLETAPPHPNGTVPSPLSLLLDCYIITSYSSAQRLLPSCVFISWLVYYVFSNQNVVLWRKRLYLVLGSLQGPEDAWPVSNPEGGICLYQVTAKCQENNFLSFTESACTCPAKWWSWSRCPWCLPFPSLLRKPTLTSGPRGEGIAMFLTQLSTDFLLLFLTQLWPVEHARRCGKNTIDSLMLGPVVWMAGCTVGFWTDLVWAVGNSLNWLLFSYDNTSDL